MQDRAVSASGQVARIAQTPKFGFGVNPSPVPDPQSFQNPASGIRMKESRAAPICPRTQSRAGNASKRNRESDATFMTGLVKLCQTSLTVFATRAKGNAENFATERQVL